MSVVRINITVPEYILKELEKEVPERGKSSFVAGAIEEKLARKKREKALEELLGAPASFTKIKDSAVYIRKTRRLDNKRLKRLGI
ncbi:MAG: hypothetical protein Q7K55_04215 [Candidatus Levybacteria bacterium]|nr:hypothetical protein [Candidatus Levybacteria bacterium]